MSSDDALVVEGAEFSWGGAQAVAGIHLQAHRGEVTVLASPNGAGKTTLLWLAAGLLRPARGTVRVFGRDPFRDREVLGRVGFVAEGAPLPERWTGAQVLAFQRQTFPVWDEAVASELVERMRLDLGQRVGALSRGQRGRLALVAALGTRPDLLLLDEPTLGLDVATRRLVTRAVLGQLAASGCAVVMATHDVSDAERVGDRLVVLQDGRVRRDEAIADLLERHRILSWGHGVAPDPAWEPTPLPSLMGQRALVGRWGPAAAAGWRGEVAPADLETIYLALTGEVDHAW